MAAAVLTSSSYSSLLWQTCSQQHAPAQMLHRANLPSGCMPTLDFDCFTRMMSVTACDCLSCTHAERIVECTLLNSQRQATPPQPACRAHSTSHGRRGNTHRKGERRILHVGRHCRSSRCGAGGGDPLLLGGGCLTAGGACFGRLGRAVRRVAAVAALAQSAALLLLRSLLAGRACSPKKLTQSSCKNQCFCIEPRIEPFRS